MWPATDLVQNLVYSENGRSVDTVLVGGEVVLEDGKSVRIDESELAAQARELAQKVEAAKAKWSSQKGSPELIERYRDAERDYREAARRTHGVN